jgi:hypothetical protein
MRGAMVYGGCLGLGFATAQWFAQPIVWVVCWTALTLQLGWGAALTWRRTALPFATMGMLLGGTATGALAVLSVVGFVFPALPLRLAVPVYSLVVAVPLCFLIESRVHRAAWLQWQEYMRAMSAIDIVRGRHIPNLRDR